MDIKKALAACLSESSLGLTRTEVEQMLESELNKPEAEMDGETVELCVELLAQTDDAALPKEKQAPPAVFPAAKRRRHPGRRVLLVAAIVVLLTAMTLIVSAQVFHVDLVHYAVEKITNGIKVSDPKESNPLPEGADLREELAKCGFQSVYLPEAFIEGAKITRWNPQTTDVSQAISFLARKDGKQLDVGIIRYDFDGPYGDTTYQGDFQQAWELPLDGSTVFVAEFKDRFSVRFLDGYVEYSFHIYNMSKDEVFALVETMVKG